MTKSIISWLFILSFVSFNVSCLSLGKISHHPILQSGFNANLLITADNWLDAVIVNGVNIDLSSVPYLSDWTKLKSIAINFKYGDSVEVKGHNTNGYTSNNPAAFLIEIDYLDSNNNSAKLVSNNINWVCSCHDGNFLPPLVYGPNGTGLWGSTFVTTVSNSAQWIWNEDKTSRSASCKTYYPLLNSDEC